jgi:hypothetical protein
MRALKSEAQAFRKYWRTEIRRQLRFLKEGVPPEASAWEGYQAVRELSDDQNIWMLMPDPTFRNFPFFHLTERLSREAFFYRKFCGDVVSVNLSFKDVVAALSAANGKLKRVRIQHSQITSSMQAQLTECSAQIEKTLYALEEYRDTYWQQALFALPDERTSWITLDGPNAFRAQLPDELVQAEQIFDGTPYPKHLLKRIDLDTRFQIRIAVILRSYLDRDFGISLRTISRLVALTYLASGLAREKDDLLLIPERKKPITVGGIDQTIRPRLKRLQT